MSISRIDFGKAVVQDQRTGDIFVNQDGGVPTIEGLSLVIQECMVALKTIIGEEIFDATWGFDLFTVIQNPFLVEPTLLISNAVSECLDPDKIPQLKEAMVTSVENAEEEGDENKYNVNIGITTISGDNVTLDTNIGE